MAFFTFSSAIPSDYGEYQPKKFTEEELDSLHVDHGKRDACKHHLAEYKQCALTVRQHYTAWYSVKKKHLKENCMYYHDHWGYCRQVEGVKNGLGSYFNY